MMKRNLKTKKYTKGLSESQRVLWRRVIPVTFMSPMLEPCKQRM